MAAARITPRAGDDVPSCPQVLRAPELIVLAGLLAFGCGGNPETPSEEYPEESLDEGPRPNVLLITLDTTRADLLGAYGHPDVDTPNVDRLAREGVLFEHCASPVPLTAPSRASLFTATYPFVHGVRDNGQFILGQDHGTLAEALSARGYATGAQGAVCVLNAHAGLAQGFATYRDTLLVADHGEAFGEHSEIGHSYFVYDTTTRVPLLMKFPGRIPAGARVTRQVRLVDVAPTILDLAGQPPLPGVQRTSLVPYLEDVDRDLELFAYVETLAPFLDYRYSPLRGLRNDRWKYVLAPRPELYDLTSDPGETQNTRGADPKDRIPQMMEASTALRLLGDGRYEAAERMYRELLSVDRDNLLFLLKRVECLAALSRGPEALATVKRVLDLEPDHAEAVIQEVLEADGGNVEAAVMLSKIEFAQGEYAGALGHLEKMLSVAPGSVPVLIQLAWLLSRYDEALQRMREAREGLAPRPDRAYFEAYAARLEQAFENGRPYRSTEAL